MKRIVRERCFKYYSKDVDKKKQKKQKLQAKNKIKINIEKEQFPSFFFCFFFNQVQTWIFFRVLQSNTIQKKNMVH